jgi:magnesium transporter
MSDIKSIKSRVRKIGMIPGELIQQDNVSSEVVISVMDYDKDSFVEKTIDAIEDCFEYKEKKSVTWINIDGNHSKDIIEKIGVHYDVHPLILEDIMTVGQRPKIEDYGGYIYVVMKMVYPDRSGKTVDEQVSLLFGANFVITIQEKPLGDPFNIIRDRIRNNLGRIRKSGADYLAYSIMDIIVDNYYVILEKIGENIETMEDETLEKPSSDTLHKIHAMKRDLISFRKFVWPLREVVNMLGRNDSGLIDKNTLPYMRDIYDHVIQLIDSVETYRDISATILDIYLSSQSNRLNLVMKRLTLINCIFMPLTVIAGIGGMSEWSMMTGSDNWRISYPLFFAGLLAISFITYRIFKWKGWT